MAHDIPLASLSQPFVSKNGPHSFDSLGGHLQVGLTRMVILSAAVLTCHLCFWSNTAETTLLR